MLSLSHMWATFCVWMLAACFPIWNLLALNHNVLHKIQCITPLLLFQLRMCPFVSQQTKMDFKCLFGLEKWQGNAAALVFNNFYYLKCQDFSLILPSGWLSLTGAHVPGINASMFSEALPNNIFHTKPGCLSLCINLLFFNTKTEIFHVNHEQILLALSLYA